MSDDLRVQWNVIPSSAPQPWLNCNRCRSATRFRASDKIRVNASGKRIDAWLIYKCTSCDNTWNRPILERRPVSTIDPQLLAALQANDPELARRLAFDAALSRHSFKVEHFDEVIVSKETVSGGAAFPCRLEIACILRQPTGLRVDRLLAAELRLSRSRIQNMQDAGHLAACPGGLRRPLRDGLCVRIDLLAVDDGASIVLAATGGEA